MYITGTVSSNTTLSTTLIKVRTIHDTREAARKAWADDCTAGLHVYPVEFTGHRRAPARGDELHYFERNGSVLGHSR